MKYILSLILLLVVACGEDVQPQNEFMPRTETERSSCSGCLSESECRSGVDDSACGAGGEVCVVCETGYICDENRECSIPPECTPENCEGCCQANGRCETGDSENACGAGAAACLACSAGWTCELGDCIPPAELCGPENCAGCCDELGVCKTGDSDMLCGLGGGVCSSCSAPEICAAGSCSDANSCANTCTGCCVGETCINPTSDQQCGLNGQTCLDCPDEQICGAGVCQTPSFFDVEIISTVVAPTKPNGSGWDSFNGTPEQYIEVLSFDPTAAERQYSASTGEVSALNHSWNQVLDMNIPLAAIQHNFAISMKEGDSASADDLICSFENIPVDADVLLGSPTTSTCVKDSRTTITWRLIPQ